MLVFSACIDKIENMRYIRYLTKIYSKVTQQGKIISLGMTTYKSLSKY